MPALLIRSLIIVLGGLLIACAWYYRLRVAPRLPADDQARIPTLLRPGTRSMLILVVVLTILVGIVILQELFLLLNRVPTDSFDVQTVVFLAVLNALYLYFMLRIQRRIQTHG